MRALAVVVEDASEIEAERGIAGQRVGGVAHHHVDFARLHGGEALLRGQRHVPDLVGVAEQRRRHGTADIDRQAAPLALAVGQHEARRADADAAIERAARLDGVEILAGHGGARQQQAGQAGRDGDELAH